MAASRQGRAWWPRWVIGVVLLAVAVAPTVAAASCPRIVSQSPYITHSLRWLGLADCIVGASRYDPLKVPPTGGVLDPDYQAIALLEPDLMLTSDWTDGQGWRENAPRGARAMILDGFESMAQIADNLRRIGRAAGLKGVERRVAAFRAEWRERARAVPGNGRRVLLVSACSGQPYSFGRHTWLFDLFSRAGFTVVEDHPGIRHIRKGSAVATIRKLVERTEPELLFVLTPEMGRQCRRIRRDIPVRVVRLDGGHFLHPAPVILKGLADLQRMDWSEAGS